MVIGVRGMGGAEDDDLRRGIAAAIRSRLRATDMVARLDDADFGVLLVEAPARAARSVAGQLVGSVQHAVGSGMRVAAGITVYPDGGPRSGAALLADAEVALLEAREGAGPAVTFDTGLGLAREARGAPASRAERLRRALEEDDWVLASRPVVEIETDVVLQQDLFVARRRRGRHASPVPPSCSPTPSASAAPARWTRACSTGWSSWPPSERPRRRSASSRSRSAARRSPTARSCGG